MLNRTSTIPASIAFVANDQIFAYSIVLRQVPVPVPVPEWAIPEDPPQVSHGPSKYMIGIAKHDIGVFPLSVQSVEIPLDYEGDKLATVSDVADYEWDELFTECGRVWPEFDESRGVYVKRIHLIHKILEAAGVR
jgi:hypothetical protein